MKNRRHRAGPAATRAQHGEANLQVVLVIICLVFVLTHIPRLILAIEAFVRATNISRCMAYGRTYVPPLFLVCLEAASNLLILVNASSNFLIYCFTSIHFKVFLHRKFTREVRHSTINGGGGSGRQDNNNNPNNNVIIDGRKSTADSRHRRRSGSLHAAPTHSLPLVPRSSPLAHSNPEEILVHHSESGGVAGEEEVRLEVMWHSYAPGDSSYSEKVTIKTQKVIYNISNDNGTVRLHNKTSTYFCR